MQTAEALPRERGHIVIAEDSLTQAERLRHALECGGYRVTVAVDGRKALEQIRTLRPGLVISDVLMPEMDGYELCRRIKCDRDLQGIPVILVTTLSDSQDLIRGLECHADNFVVKPYDEAYLLARVEAVLRKGAAGLPQTESAGVDIELNGQRHSITAGRLHILSLLLSTYDAAMQRNRELMRMKDALRDSNAALETANDELKAFSYSVSHDLRAPVRAIEGFSQNLQDDYGGILDARGGELLQRIRNAGHRMKELIEDLLTLAQISRGELRREQVDMSVLAESVATELHHQQPDRSVDVTVTPGLVAEGDARLLRVVFENLIGNAWKFTSKTLHATIEVGMAIEDGARVFFVRDNGAGFDMNYAHRLFGAFQRLHSNDEFSGSGIGLATVRRIVHRHGGRIWARGTPGAGARFSFVL